MPRPTLLDVKDIDRRALRPASLAAVLFAAAVALAGCTGSSTPAEPAGAGPEATQAAVSGGTCDKQGFTAHAALAVGSVQTYLWKPYVAGAFADGAKHRKTALTRGAGATALAAKELAAARPLISGCPSSIPLANALVAGASLAHAASVQLAAGTLNTETVAGVNSIGSTVLAQAAGNLGVRVTPAIPTPAQLAVAS
jgi:hypothetical protein